MKRTVMFFCLLCVFCLLSQTAFGDSVTDRQAEAIDTDSIENGLAGTASEIMEGESIKDGIDTDNVIGRIFQTGRRSLPDILKNSVMSASALVFTAMLCTIAAGLVKTNGLGDIDYITLVGVISVAVLSFGGVRSVVSQAADVIDEIGTFSKLLLPSLTAAAAAGGTAASASAKYAVVSLFMEIMISVIGKLIIPLIYAYIAASIASAAFGGEGLNGAAELIKWAAVNVLIVVVLVFTVYITVSGVVSGTADAAATRLTKTVISTALPVVGSIISDAAGTVLTGAETLKNTVGVFGLLAVLAICVVPFLNLGINYLIYKGAALLAAAVADKNISKAIGAVSTATGIALGAAGTCALMLFFSIVSVIKAVSVI